MSAPTKTTPASVSEQPLTREALQAIAQRYSFLESVARDSEQELSRMHHPAHEPRSLAHREIGMLLDLLLRLARAPAVINLPEGGKVCTRCGALSGWMAEGPPKCDPECPAPLLEALR